MVLADYLRDECLTAAEFGRRIGRSRSCVTKWLDGTNKPDLAAVRVIEKETDGAVDRYGLRPDIYDRAAA
jgi:DNA-binding transcriptional regulator YdaS (Cro superfamily)